MAPIPYSLFFASTALAQVVLSIVNARLIGRFRDDAVVWAPYGEDRSAVFKVRPSGRVSMLGEPWVDRYGDNGWQIAGNLLYGLNPIDRLALCVADLKRAIELHGACGGKKDLERAERLLKKQTAAEASAADKSDTSKDEGSAPKGSADSTAGEPGQASG